MLSDLMTAAAGCLRRYSSRRSYGRHIACTLRDVGRGGQDSQSIAQPIRQRPWDSSSRRARSSFQGVAGLRSGHTAPPSAALTMPESTLRLSGDLWHLPGATRRAPAGRLVTRHLGSQHDHLRRHNCKLSPAPSNARRPLPAAPGPVRSQFHSTRMEFAHTSCRRQPVASLPLKGG